MERISSLNISDTRKRWLERDLLRCLASYAEHPMWTIRRMHSLVTEIPEGVRDSLVALISGLGMMVEAVPGHNPAVSLEASHCDSGAIDPEVTDPNRHGVDLGIVCAMHKPELAQVIRAMDEMEDCSDESGDTFMYQLGLFRGRDKKEVRVAAAAQNEMGMTDCAVLTTQLILRYRPKHLIMVGVAAGNPEKTKIGDIAIPDTIYNYQSGKLTNAGFEKAPMPVRVDDALLQKVGRVPGDALDTICRDWAGNDFGTPRVRRGSMACGYTVLNRDGTFIQLAEWDRTTVAVDMESYAAVRAARLCTTTDYHCAPLVMKGIMDHGENKSDDAKAYAAYVSAQFLRAFALSELG